ncbi:hypothetical protein [Streptomyces canus]|uniref:hypothetical protein n=1 Tax=Streptomyces canus TaxID=58343 RepID=UPI0033B62BE0
MTATRYGRSGNHLRAYARRLTAGLHNSTTFASVTRQGGAWSVRAEDGRKFTARGGHRGDRRLRHPVHP